MFRPMIYNNNTYTDFEINENGDIRNIKTNHVYKKTIHCSGYYVVTLPLGKRGKVKSIRVHKALAETFIPNPNNYNIVNHKDENKLNINLDNLEWTNSKTNTNYYLENRYKENPLSNNRKLLKDDIIFILNSNMSLRELAKKFNVSKTTIISVKKRRTYKEV